MSAGVLAIDPGASTGWAFFRGAMLIGAGLWKRDHFITMDCFIDEAIQDHGMHDLHVVVEIPGARGAFLDRKLWRSIAAVNIRAGGYLAVAELHRVAEAVAVPVSTWKGGGPQAKKDQVEARLRMLYPKADHPNGSDAWDAIGLGHWTCGILVTGQRIEDAVKARTRKGRKDV